ncbi:HAMP domain-containing protein [Sulfurimonas aquatica]|uniref:histidine kinase n=1 Tax=Sulfurimonas aquatica TaxID=2672570 RepID=A0A975AYL9_9BACT|nr:HAMP domain-containing sensor histidine kinase [Sulfurimonas aquatica]QSZ40997.1 HAMP domain-containing protein [Sulfurimonas aquatica]
MSSKNSLFKRTFFIIVTGLLSVVTLFSYLTIMDQKSALIEVMYSKTKTIAKSISLVSSDAMVIEDYGFIVEHNEKVLQDNKEISYILIVKKGEGESKLYSDVNRWELVDKLPDSVTASLLSNEYQSIIKNGFSKSAEDVFHYSYPVVFSGLEWGWVTIGFSLERYKEMMNSIYVNNAILIVTILFGSMLFSLLLARWITKPIFTLNEAAKQVALGDYSVAVNVDTDDELGELASSFNIMINTIKLSSERLYAYNEELESRVEERTDELITLNQELDQRVKDEVHKRAEQEQILIQQSRFAAMGEMIGNIAHQWRQPLNALGLLLQNIENAYEMDMLDEEYINRSIEKGTRLTNGMSQTIDDFRNFFKPNKEALTFSIASIIETAMGMLRPSLNNHNIEVKEEIDKNVLVRGFPSEFSQVILNIVNNSKDALLENRESQREIYIRVFEKGDYAYLEIEDNAGGIPKEIIKKVFDPYFTTKDEGKGTGIGLYMSKTIIENNMSGVLSVHNTEHGACFVIKIKVEDSKGK